MAMRQVFVDDLTDKELDEKDAAKVSVKVGDSNYVLDTHKNGELVKQIIAKGKKQAVRGRKANGK